MSINEATVNQLSMSWGTTPLHLTEGGTREEMLIKAMKLAAAKGHVRAGDQVALLNGDGVGAKVTNNLRIMVVPT